MVELKSIGPRSEILIKGELSTTDYRRLEEIVLALMVVPSQVVVMLVESEGGALRGLREVALSLQRLREKKFVVAFAREALSAAYWIASVAHVVYASPGATIGAVGVVAVHDNYRKYYEMIGVEKSLFVSEGNERKIEITPYDSLSDEAKVRLQRRLNAIGEEFMQFVERQRALKVGREVWASGEAFDANDALAIGLVDKVVHPFDFEQELQRDYAAAIVRGLE